MAFRRTYLSHRPRHEELAENNMQCYYDCCGCVCRGIERHRWRRAPASGCPPPTRVCTAATLPRTDAMQREIHAARNKSITFLFEKKIIKKKYSSACGILKNIMSIWWLIPSANECSGITNYGCWHILCTIAFGFRK